jgi:hypothetical protein
VGVELGELAGVGLGDAGALVGALEFPGAGPTDAPPPEHAESKNATAMQRHACDVMKRLST